MATPYTGAKQNINKIAMNHSLHSGTWHIPLEYRVMATPYTRASAKH